MNSIIARGLKRKLTWIFLFLGVCFIFWQRVFPILNLMHVTSEVKIPQQQAINRKFECKKSGYVCISSYLKSVTITSGPTVALEKLELLLKKGAISKDIDTRDPSTSTILS